MAGPRSRWTRIPWYPEHQHLLMLAKNKLKTLNQVTMIKIKTMSMVVILHQMVIKIKLKMKSKLKLESELVMKVKERTKIMVMTKWLLKNLLKKLKLAVL
jgi:hypothetical protein